MSETPRNLEKYEILERLGGGGMAEVFLGRSTGHEGFAKLVAIKRVLQEHARGSFIDMMVDEALIASNLNHINICQIYDLVRAEETCFIVMEYIQGVSLNKVLGRLMRQKQPMPPPMAAFFLRQVCAGLDYAHNRVDNKGRPLKIIHRDISPDNVMASFEGEVKLIDFGIAKAARRLHATQVGQIKGKFAYMSPEQARGWQLDHRSDIFSTGLMLYEFLTLSNPYDCEESLIQAVSSEELPPPSFIVPGLPLALDGICASALAINPWDRYASAGEMERDLETFQRDNPFTRRELAVWITETFNNERTAMELLVEATSAGVNNAAATVMLSPEGGAAGGAAAVVAQEGPALGAGSATILDETPAGAEPVQPLRSDAESVETVLLSRSDAVSAETVLLSRSDPAPLETVLLPRSDEAPAGAATVSPPYDEASSVPSAAPLKSKEASRRRTRIRATLIVVLATVLGGTAATVVFSLAMCDTTLPAATAVSSRQLQRDLGAPRQPQYTSAPTTTPAPSRSAARSDASVDAATGSSASSSAAPARPVEGHQKKKTVRLRRPRRPRRTGRPHRVSRPRRHVQPSGHGWITVVTTDGAQQVWANVSLDGKAIGKSMIYRKKVKAGQHVVVVQRSGYRVAKQTIRLRTNQERRVLLKLRRAKRDR